MAVRWGSFISERDPPHRFHDTQVIGPRTIAGITAPHEHDATKRRSPHDPGIPKPLGR
jgi:hypothetical protein